MKSLTIIKLDGIGDYILFRNFLISLHHNGYKITLIGNDLWRSLAEHYDNSIIDKFIWININDFIANRFYRKWIQLRISMFSCEMVFSPTFSRRYYIEDHIAKWMRARMKIAPEDDCTNKTPTTDNESKKIYSQLIKVPEDIHFEFDRYQSLLDTFLSGCSQSVHRPSLPSGSIHIDINSRYVVLVPGANESFRKWPIERFSQLANYIASQFNLKLVVCGSQSEKNLGDFIVNKSENKDRVMNLCGKTSLVDYCAIIQNAEFTIGNDSSAIHIAAATNTTAICISNGNHFGRFNPYPQNISKDIHYIYPFNPINSYNNYMVKYRKGSNLDISLVELGKVTALFDRLASDLNA